METCPSQTVREREEGKGKEGKRERKGEFCGGGREENVYL